MRNFILVLFTILFVGGIAAQDLNEKISIELNNVSMTEALRRIEKTTQSRFAYNSEIFADFTIEKASFRDKTMNEVLDSLLGSGYAYRSRGRYIIIKSTGAVKQSNKKFKYIISGYVRDAESGDVIPFASVYDSASLSSSLTDASGFYSMELAKESDDPVNIVVSKTKYIDTYIVVQPIVDRLISVELNPSLDSLEAKPSMSDKITNFFVGSKQQIANLNIKTPILRNAQISFLPYIGTHGRLSGSVTNNYSLNILGGYNKGFRKIELGGIANIDRDSSTGFQAAGILNKTGVYFKGTQFAGIANVHTGDFAGFQAGGIVNLNSGDVKGMQAAGIHNLAKSVDGVQAAGILNTTMSIRGTQIGLINISKKVRGTQIGLINLADSVRGAQIGFLSFSNNGVLALEAFTTDVNFYNLRLKTGSKKFFNIIGISSHTELNNRSSSVNYGLGTVLKEHRRYQLQLQLTGSAFYQGNFDFVPSLYSLAPNFQLNLGKHLYLFGQADANFYLDNTLNGPEPGYRTNPSSIQPIKTFTFKDNNRGKLWVGFSAGIGIRR